VRVHEEIKAYGCVVDPGCMKCMDCVSVCPTDALSFRFARPSARRKPSEGVKRHFDTSVGEDVALLGVFGFSFFAVRGLYGLIPLLMAMGIAACITFLAWKAWRTMRDESVRMTGVQLRYKGALTGAGRVFLVAAGLGAALLVHSSVVNAAEWRSSLEARRLGISKQVALTPGGPGFDERTKRSARRILELDGFARRWGLLERPDAMTRSALMHLVLDENARAEALLRGLVASGDAGDELIADLGRVIMLDPPHTEDAIALYEDTLAEHPEYWSVREAWSLVMFEGGRTRAVIDEADGALEAMSGRPRLAHARARTLLTKSRAERVLGRPDDALTTLREAVEEDPHSAVVRENYAAALLQIVGDAEGAAAQLARAVRDAPHDAQLRFQLGRLRLIAGDAEGAIEAFGACVELDPSDDRRAMIAEVMEQAGIGARIGEFTD